MLYIINVENIDNVCKNHFSFNVNKLEHLQLLRNEGRLLTAGFIPAIDSNDPGNIGFTGSIIISEFDSLEEVQHWIRKDLFLFKKINKKISVKPYKKIF